MNHVLPWWWSRCEEKNQNIPIKAIPLTEMFQLFNFQKLRNMLGSLDGNVLINTSHTNKVILPKP